MSQSDPLLQPFQLKHLALRNRVISTCHEPAYAEDGHPRLRYQLYHEEKARGGVAMTMFGGSANVAPDSPSVFGQLYLGDDTILPYLSEMAERIHRHGAHTICQITHMGRRTKWNSGQWLPAIAPSPVREPAHRSFPKEMEEADIRRVVAAYGAAAARCRQGDLDGVEVVGSGHLLDSFWSPLINVRDDDYGGSLDNRMRFAFEVLEEIRRRVGDDFVVGMRITGNEALPGGLTVEDCLEIARRLARSGMIDYLNVVNANIYTSQGLSKRIPPMGTPSAPNLEMVSAIRAEVDLPILHACRISDVATARYAVETGKVDLVGMTRAHIAEPHIVLKLQQGEEERIRPCVGVGYCIDGIYEHGEALCIHNASTGREATMPHEIPAAGRRRRVVVVGGGPGGLEAARVCGERGHDVVLFEANRELGGQIQLAAKPERRRDLIGIVDWRRAELERLGVDVRLNTYASASDVLGLEPDVVIVATGGLPNTSFLAEGEDLVATTWDVLGGHVRPGAEVLFFDDSGQHQSASCAEFLAARGSRLEFVTPDRTVFQEIGGTNYPPYLEAFAEHGVTITLNERLVGVRRSPSGRLEADLYNEYAQATTVREVDQVVVEHGTLPIDELYRELAPGSTNLGEVDLDALIDGRPQSAVANPDGAYQLFRIGDAVASRNIHAAIYDALRLCKDL